MQKKQSKNIFWFLHGILIIIFCLGWARLGVAIENNDNCAEGLNYIEYLNSSSQRLVKLELANTPNEELIYHLNNVIKELDPTEIYGDCKYVDIEKTEIIIKDLQDHWVSLFDELVKTRLNGDNAELIFSSERFYNTAILLTLEANNQFREMSDHIYNVQFFLFIIVILISIVVILNVYNVIKELKQAKMLSNKMFIDANTGLYNRSKCQEILKDTTTPANLKSRIMVMFDINDLKVTNDNYGHQVGDELISDFAKILKESSKVHYFDIFIGRYGGDEFMVYYPSADEEDVLIFLDEVNYLCDRFNKEEEKKYNLSFSVGYAVFGSDRSSSTMRDLFKAADENMYLNKANLKKEQVNNEKMGN